MFCSQCGTALPDNAAFCSSCGSQQPAVAGGTATAAPPAPQPQAPMPVACASCGTMVQPGRRFCTRCGHSMTGAPAASAATRPGSSAAWSTSEILLAGGLAVALIGTLLEWVSFGGEGISGWNTDARFRVAEWLGATAPIDAALVAAAAALGAYLTLGPKVGLRVPALPFGAAAAAGVVLAVGILEWVYIDDVGQGVIDPGIGIYAVIAGGGAATVAPFLAGFKPSR